MVFTPRFRFVHANVAVPGSAAPGSSGTCLDEFQADPALAAAGPGLYPGDEEAAVTMQVAIHLNDVEHEVFSRWLAGTAVAVDPDNPHLEASEAISAMIRVAMRYTDITGRVASQLRFERAAARDRKAPPIITGPDTIDRP